ncbi:MAG: hypothetical protein ACD_76C00161G0017 [uncultured bacterium]|nr:MAG: hypothetical protein ACD_76C00161G0017 [uncultured bacterium]
MITIIAAVAKNGVIGKNNELPWDIPEDLKRFRELTRGKTVLMGRKTFESIVTKLGTPLPKRTNVVITRQTDYTAPDGVLVFQSVDSALASLSDQDICIIGGAEIYRQTIDRTDALEITHLDRDYEGDTVFPNIDPQMWRIASNVKQDDLRFVRYERK